MGQGFDGSIVSSRLKLAVIIVGARSHARSAISAKYGRKRAPVLDITVDRPE
ncbi:MAG: hypothetical protein JGK17_10590 [Microcoleus sp. PH2017_10_PVI_O_A]|uniref:hypothetical protein n=1 Tax=unclassified Microcoleus TaxID=2642155 RepID=UPI001D99C730|nr:MULTISPECIES: hypothetical protein [unclassified Microcoleus]MCC3406021.1 hypothetical protein [Microcoleus sp. PH2017_10_PVI_O_A]MCC3463938.1 hypothetical protein [Microcoleus sp. PH2017_11_PCY_U_A]MCC3482264.1 hypothetical protein [Microcoleus sp. PH2017_12_PCY_D_A]MCC3532122.1 hypothetical protein [Microcoleus sp. PH2017_21_RUC_O_A]MCC3544426.1 hypothetical protein [Microcoleus sp. PH2017_22_RUC_O_B]